MSVSFKKHARALNVTRSEESPVGPKISSFDFSIRTTRTQVLSQPPWNNEIANEGNHLNCIRICGIVCPRAFRLSDFRICVENDMNNTQRATSGTLFFMHTTVL